MATTMTPEETVRAWNDLYAAQQIDECIKYFAEDFFRLGDSNGWQPVGKDQWAEVQKGFMKGWPDWTWEMLSIMSVDNKVWCEFQERATHTGVYDAVPGFVFEPTGLSYTDRCGIIFELNDEGLIRAIRAYYTNNLERTYHVVEKAMAAREASAAS